MFKKKPSLEYQTLESIMLAIDELRLNIDHSLSVESQCSSASAIRLLAEAYNPVKRGKKG